MNAIIASAKQIIFTVTLYPFFSLLQKIRKRNKNIILVIGRDDGKLLDNCKYILSALKNIKDESITIYYVSRNEQTLSSLHKSGIKCFKKQNNISTILFLLSSGIIIVDSLDWSKNGWHLAYRGAKIIQLWHGIPLKEIELGKTNRSIVKKNNFIKKLINIYWELTQRFPKFYALIATSPFSNNLLSQCIRNVNCWNTGYPRTDVLLKNSLTEFDYLNTEINVLKKISIEKEKNNRIVFYCPTFRDGMINPLSNSIIDISRFDKIFKKYQISLFIKFHPWIKDTKVPSDITNVTIIRADSDAYPLLRYADLLITDYSSIYFDFLLLDKPILFFPYDLEAYKKDERALLLDYDEFTPGEKCFSIPKLILKIVRKSTYTNDKFYKERKKIKDIMFQYQDDKAAERIVSRIIQSL